MNRRNFTRTCMVGVAGVIAPPLLSACRATHYTSGTIEANGIVVMKSEFMYVKKDQPVIRKYIIVRNDALEYPIYLYRFSNLEYSALYMKCSHQGAELNASGDRLHCPSHGSEFNNRGVVEQGPAEKNLRSLKVSAENDRIFIDLRA